MPRRSLQPARIAFEAGGTPYSEDYGDVYHSADGGPAQARHVFFAGNGLPERWRRRRSFTILEAGFGLGLNFACCAEALLGDADAPERLHYVAAERYPPQLADLVRAHARWPQFAPIAAELQRAWPPALRGFHRIELAGGRIALTLLFGDAAAMLAELDACVDAVFLDGFAPAKNPAMWSEALFRQIGRLSAPGTTAATWSVASAVRARLGNAGFEVEKRPGFGRKRQMLAAIRPGDAGCRASVVSRVRHALVIGGGIAGCWTAHALARRGWDVELFERRPEPAQEASGNAIGAIRPALNLADNVNARLSRAAFLYTTRMLQRNTAWHGAYRASGVLQVATSEERAARMAAIIEAHDFPHEYVRWVGAGEAARFAQHRVAGPGWWIADGGWAQPQALCRALIETGEGRIRTHFDRSVHDLEPAQAGWRVCDASSRVLAEAAVVILANGYEARRYGPADMTRLIGVRGQVSFLPAAIRRSLEIVVCGDGFVAPLADGRHCVGATFEPGVDSAALRTEDHASNLERVERMLPGFAAGLAPARLDGWAGVRAATPDRLPLCGSLDDEASGEDAGGRHIVSGMGARGLIWAPLCAEVLASRLEGEPNPIERSLVAAMDPLRERARSR